MLKSLHLKDFTVFREAAFPFARHLNVVVGANGLGKTHVLKAAYTIMAVSAQGRRESGSATPTKSYLQPALATKLQGVFKPDELGRLAQRRPGRTRAEVSCHFDDPACDFAFSFNNSSKREVSVDRTPGRWIQEVPVYLPTRELLTIYPGFVSLFETTYLPFEETWRDTAVLLGAPLARGPREPTIRKLLAPLETAMGGGVEMDDTGRFYLKTPSGRFEMHLVAEGFRKLATIARLIANGSLLGKGSLFWDEPEANLNPELVKLVARTILDVSESGIQVFIATHSLFLLRELHIAQKSRPDLNSSFFGLHPAQAGVRVDRGPTIDDIGDIVALDEELGQSERYLESEQEADMHGAA